MTLEQWIRQHFQGSRHPEHVEDGFRPILSVIQDEVEMSPDDWEEVLDTLRTEVEFDEATWL